MRARRAQVRAGFAAPGFPPQSLHQFPRWMRHAQMQAYVYKSLRKADTYVYLAARDAFQVIPEPLRQPRGGLAFVLEVALTPERRLARADAAQVRQNLLAHGFHLQVPPSQAELPVAFGGQVHG